MKLKIVAVSAITLMSVGMAATGNAQVGVNVGIGVPAPAMLAIQPPSFVMMPDLGFYAAVGVQQDLFFAGNLYYLYQGGNWFSSQFYGGPWGYVPMNRMPIAFRRYNFDRIRTSRNNVYMNYRRGGFKGQQFRPMRPAQRPAGRPGAGGDHRPGPGGGGHRR
ncbi:MAG: hypothetical protein FWD70_05735 [Desulfuromonadales bacterium]|nr:hypothetical protein [Desulfuromonadales bacterium]